MANLMKFCKKCATWTDKDISSCPNCNSELTEVPLTNIYWNKLSDKEKEKYTQSYMEGKEYFNDDPDKDLLEEVILQLNGYNGQLYVYEDKLIIERKGFLGMISNGLSGRKTIPMSTIQNIQFKEAGSLFNGYIQFGILGGIEKQNGLSGAVNDENSIIFLESGNAKALEIKDYIEKAILSRGNAVNPSTANNLFVADEIMKLKQLLDMEVLTQDEFNMQKKRLLQM